MRARTVLAPGLLVGSLALLALGVRYIANLVHEETLKEQCKNNLRLVALGVNSYVPRSGSFPPPPPAGSGVPFEKRQSWLVAILGDLFCWHCWGLEELGGIDPALPWDDPSQHRFATLPLKPVICPKTPHQSTGGVPSNDSQIERARSTGLVPSSYVGIAGVGLDAAMFPLADARVGVFGLDRKTRPEDITDGASTTMMIAETADLRAAWTAGGSATIRGLDPDRQPYLGAGRQFGGMHEGGAMVAFVDGSVRFVRASITPSVFESMATIHGNETLPAGWDQ